MRQRLRREARAAATISHPGVAVVYALEEFDDHLFIASEYVSGETLRGAIARGPIAPGRVRSMAVEIASALGAAHDAGVIHRDLKPENVLIRTDGSIKIVDFGIAQIESPESTRLTRAGAMLGTPAYMAPEQLLGRPVDSRADIYAVGIVLSEMLTGHHPFRAEHAPSARDAGNGALATIIARCVEADPAARFATVRELQSALKRESTSTQSGEPEGPPNRLRRGYGGPPELSAEAEGGHDVRHGDGRFWWEFHQAIVALVYSATTVPAWYARGLIGGWQGRTFFIAVMASAIIAVAARLHLWFTSRFYATELEWVHRRSRGWIHIADWMFAITLAAGGILIREEHSSLTLILPSIAIGAVVAFVLIEPVTTRDAFRRSGVR